MRQKSQRSVYIFFTTVVTLVVVMTVFCAAFAYFGQFIHMQVSYRCYPEEGGRDHVVPTIN